MKLRIVFLLLFTSIFQANAQDEILDMRDALSAGASSGGGGYGFYRTSTRYLEEAKRDLVKALSGLTDEEFNPITRRFPGAQGTRSDLKQFIRNTDKDYLLKKTRPNPSGEIEPLLMDASTGRVIATSLFFETYNRVGLSDADFFEIKRLILHEASHLLKIGLTPDSDKDSYEFSSLLLGYLTKHVLFSTAIACGNDGNLSEKVLDCTENQTIDGATWRLVKRERGAKSFSLEIWKHDSSDLLVANLLQGMSSKDYNFSTLTEMCRSIMDSELNISWKLPSAAQLVRLYDLNSYHVFLARNYGHNSPCTWTDEPSSQICREEFAWPMESTLKKAYTNLIFSSRHKDTVLCVNR